MKIRFAIISCLAVSLLGFVGVLPASADRPTREFSPSEDWTIASEFACGTGDVLVHIVENNEYATTRTDRDGVEHTHISGVLKQTFTNLATGSSVPLNVSGPATLTYDGDRVDIVGSGNWVWSWFDNLPNQILYTTGGFHAIIDTANDTVTLTFVKQPARVENICSQLS